MVTTKHCSYGLCKSNSRYRHKDYMNGVSFIPFVKPKQDLEKYKRWAHACGRPNFSYKNVKKDTYICSKHFVGEAGPTMEHLDPIPATFTPEQNLLIERKGRRFLLMGGFIFMTVWALVFTIALLCENYISWMPYLSMGCIFTYILSFGMGPAGVTGILPTEIFNQSARPAAYMIAGSMMWINLFIVGMIFPFLVSGLKEFCFVPFAAVCVLSALYVGMFLPETKGKSLSAITAEFHKLNFKSLDPLHSPQCQAKYQLGEVCHSTAL